MRQRRLGKKNRNTKPKMSDKKFRILSIFILLFMTGTGILTQGSAPTTLASWHLCPPGTSLETFTSYSADWIDGNETISHISYACKDERGNGPRDFSIKIFLFWVGLFILAGCVLIAILRYTLQHF